MKRLLILVAVVAFTVPLGRVALAADAVDVASQVEFRGYYLDDGVPADVNDMERLMVDLPDTPAFYFVALADDPIEGADIFARDVLDRLPGGTVAVVSPHDLAAVSSDYSDEELNGALDESIKLFDTSYPDGFRAFANALSAMPTSTTAVPAAGTSSGTSSGGGSGILVPLLFIGGFVLLVVFLVRRGKRSDEKVQEKRLAEARKEIRTQLDAIANRILELNDQIRLADNDEATAHFRDASATFDAAQDEFEKATTLVALETLSDRLDHARWQLEAADAITEHREVPPEPKDRPASCFFDPTHRGGTEEATITTPAGSKTVSVCHDCAEKLRRGEKPVPRDIIVGGKRVPAPMAPRSHGGGGFDWMNVFEVVVAGMAAKAQYRNRAPRRSLGSMGGSRRTTPRRSSTRRTTPIPGPSSRTRSTGRSRSTGHTTRSGSSPKIKGRARRRRR